MRPSRVGHHTPLFYVTRLHSIYPRSARHIIARVLDEAEFERWYATAHDAHTNAEHQTQRGSFHWACFLAEQSAQFALKGLLHGLGEGAWGHDLPELGRQFTDAADERLPEEVADALTRLSRHYIAARYPDAHPSGTPAGHFRRADAEQACDDAETALRYVQDVWQRARTAVESGDDDSG